MASTTTTFPRQKLPTTQKSKEWGKRCIDAAINASQIEENLGIRKSTKDKIINLNLMSGILDPDDMKIGGVKFLGVEKNIMHFPLAKPRIDLLVGESLRKRRSWTVRAINEDAISDKEKQIQQKVMQQVVEILNSTVVDEAEAQQKLAGLDKWAKYEYQDMHERAAAQILEYLYREQNLQEKAAYAFENLLSMSEEIWCVDVVNSEPIVRLVSPINLKVLRLGNSRYIEDADVIIEDGYFAPGMLIDMYFDTLTNEQVTRIENLTNGTDANSTPNLIKYNFTSPVFPSAMFREIDESAPFEGMFMDRDLNYSLPTGFFDAAGNIRRVRVVWKSRRKVGKRIIVNPDGTIDYDWVDENYQPNIAAGEDVKWIWVNEWWEGTRIGEDIYTKIQPRPILFTSGDTLTVAGSGYVGTIVNVDTGRAMSLLDFLKPYEYMYAEILDRLKDAIRTIKLPMVELDVAKKPDFLEFDDWMYFADKLQWLIVDSMKEGEKGEAQGKLAGAMPGVGGRVLNPDMGRYIEQHIMMLRFIEQQAGTITGITEQRLGQIDNRETVGGVERSVFQSSHITQKLFMMHENTMLRLMRTLLETAKFCWRNNKSKKVQYVLDDLSTAVLNVDTQGLSSMDMGVFVSGLETDVELLNTFRMTANNLAQAQVIGIKDLLAIYTHPNMASIRRELEMAEERRMQMGQQQAKAEQEAEAAKLQNENENKEKDRQLKYYEIDAKIQADFAMATAQERIKLSLDKGSGKISEEDYNLKIRELDEKVRQFNEQLNLQKEQLSETRRSNLAKEEIARKKAAAKPASSSKK